MSFIDIPIGVWNAAIEHDQAAVQAIFEGSGLQRIEPIGDELSAEGPRMRVHGQDFQIPLLRQVLEEIVGLAAEKPDTPRTSTSAAGNVMSIYMSEDMADRVKFALGQNVALLRDGHTIQFHASVEDQVLAAVSDIEAEMEAEMAIADQRAQYKPHRAVSDEEKAMFCRQMTEKMLDLAAQPLTKEESSRIVAALRRSDDHTYKDLCASAVETIQAERETALRKQQDVVRRQCQDILKDSGLNTQERTAITRRAVRANDVNVCHVELARARASTELEVAREECFQKLIGLAGDDLSEVTLWELIADMKDPAGIQTYCGQAETHVGNIIMKTCVKDLENMAQRAGIDIPQAILSDIQSAKAIQKRRDVCKRGRKFVLDRAQEKCLAALRAEAKQLNLGDDDLGDLAEIHNAEMADEVQRLCASAKSNLRALHWRRKQEQAVVASEEAQRRADAAAAARSRRRGTPRRSRSTQTPPPVNSIWMEIEEANAAYPAGTPIDESRQIVSLALKMGMQQGNAKRVYDAADDDDDDDVFEDALDELDGDDVQKAVRYLANNIASRALPIDAINDLPLAAQAMVIEETIKESEKLPAFARFVLLNFVMPIAKKFNIQVDQEGIASRLNYWMSGWS